MDNRIRNKLYTYRYRDKKSDLPGQCDYTYKEFADRLTTEPCAYCESWDNLGLDRIDNNKGHSKSNTVVCCADCNKIRGNKFMVDRFKSMVRSPMYDELYGDYICFLLNTHTNNVYISRTNNIKRVKWCIEEYNTDPGEIIVLGEVKGTLKDLQSIYDSFKYLCVHGKWYKIDDLLEGTIASLTNHQDIQETSKRLDS